MILFECFLKKILALSIAVFFCLTGFSFAEEMPLLNMHYGVTPISQDIYDLHMIILWICVIIGIIVFSILIYSLIMHRKARGAKPATFHEHRTVEIIWAVSLLLF